MEQTRIKIEQCPHHSEPEWAPVWKVVDLEYIALRCAKQFCAYWEYNECMSDYRKNNESGRESAILDWNRRMRLKDGGT